ncbi:MAG: type 4a pilus biogenesis protein PilO [Rhodocyclaceae bacterium]|nr:type 4a pilus biogenesis protein PilO [Rhodocyclaceae bacterium]
MDFAAIVDEFRYLDSRDIGNWPRYPRIAALLALLLALLLAGWWFDWSTQLEELGSKQKQEISLKEEFLNKKKQSVNLEEYRKQLAEIDRSFGSLLKQLPNKEGMESLLIDINQAGLGRGLQFELFKPGNETIKDFYAELPIQLRVTGSYHDLGQFAGDVAKLSRIVTLSELSLSAGQGGVLNLDAVATTYRYLDSEEMARIKAAKGKGGK